MFLNTFNWISILINDVVNSYREKIVLKTLQLEFRSGKNLLIKEKSL